MGAHRLAFDVPDGWRHFDHGREQRFERGTLQMAMADLGPVDGLALAGVVAEARGLWEAGRTEDARAVLARLSLRPAFAGEEEWRAFLEPWAVVSRAGEGATPGELDEAYRAVVETVSSLPPVALETLADAALADLGHDERRSVAERRPVLVDDREGLWVDTWDRLSHDYRQRFLFLVNEGHLLVVRMGLGSFDEMEGPLDALGASLVFRPAGPS